MVRSLFIGLLTLACTARVLTESVQDLPASQDQAFIHETIDGLSLQRRDTFGSSSSFTQTSFTSSSAVQQYGVGFSGVLRLCQTTILPYLDQLINNFSASWSLQEIQLVIQQTIERFVAVSNILEQTDCLTCQLANSQLSSFESTAVSITLRVQSLFSLSRQYFATSSSWTQIQTSISHFDTALHPFYGLCDTLRVTPIIAQHPQFNSQIFSSFGVQSVTRIVTSSRTEQSWRQTNTWNRGRWGNELNQRPSWARRVSGLPRVPTNGALDPFGSRRVGRPGFPGNRNNFPRPGANLPDNRNNLPRPGPGFPNNRDNFPRPGLPGNRDNFSRPPRGSGLPVDWNRGSRPGGDRTLPSFDRPPRVTRPSFERPVGRRPSRGNFQSHVEQGKHDEQHQAEQNHIPSMTTPQDNQKHHKAD